MRQYIDFNADWMFSKEGNDAIQVQLPHTWNAQDGQDGGNDYYRGTCLYKKVFTKPCVAQDDKVYIAFDGVNASATIVLNGKGLATHDGGYATFRVDLTETLKDENTLEVWVDNSPNRKVYPQRADFTFYGGIYRDVKLIVVKSSHFALDDFGGPGIKVTPKVQGADALVEIETQIRGDYDAVKLTIEGEGSSWVKPDPSMKQNVVATLPIHNVHLWHGLKDPYLYIAKAELVVDGQVVDSIETTFGCRSYSFDAEKGFLLNGESYPLRGVSRHQDRRGVGNALTREMHQEDMAFIEDIGANAIRLAHYQHDQYFYDLCDQKGMVVWAEIPYITEHMPEGRANTMSQLTELISQNYNHPSIICWGLSNEITLLGITEDLVENHQLLNDLAHKMDPTRVTAMANLFMVDINEPILDLPDIMSYNLYYGWYVGEMEDNDTFLEGFHKAHPTKCIGLSEYGADTYYGLQSENPIKGDCSEQYQCIYHEHMLRMFDKMPYLWSTFVWNMFDFAADARDDVKEPGVNHKGLVSFDRQVRKDAFYAYKAWWSQEPFVHLCGRRYVDRTEEVTKVKVYSNQQAIALYKDGVCIAEQVGDHVFCFEVAIEGEHLLEACVIDAAGEEKMLRDKIQIRKVVAPNPDYFIGEEAVTNWFDAINITVIPGYFSIKDTVGAIKAVPEGKVLIEKMMLELSTYQGDMADRVVITESMQQMINRFTLENLIKQAGKVEEETVSSLNAALNQIQKPAS